MVALFTTTVEAADPDVCYAVADGPGNDDVITVARVGGLGFSDLTANDTGTTVIEASTLSLDGDTLYAANASTFGTINLATEAYSALGSFGTAGGVDGETSLSDVDGLAIDARTGIFWGVHRRSGTPPDLLFQINPANGAHVPNAFGSGVDYVEIDPSSLAGSPNDVDDIAIDPTSGLMYAVANNGGGNDRLILVDMTTGAVTDVGRLFEDNDNDDVLDPGEEVNDMEGFSFFNDGTFYGTTGNNGAAATNDRFWQVNIATGEITELENIGDANHTDYEAVSCLTGGSNIVEGTVFQDLDGDGINDVGEGGTSGVTVFLYIDENNDGLVDANDTLIQTVETDANGDYSFEMGIEGNFVTEIDTADLPAGASLTTDNVEEADFTGWGNTDSGNDFGWELPANANVCYAVADRDDPDDLVTIPRDGSSGASDVSGGNIGRNNIEAMTMSLDGLTIYVADAGQFGSVDRITEAFTAIGSGFGSGGGADGTQSFTDVDGLAMDARSGILYGVHRREGSPNDPDLLFQIDPSTGARVPNAFGAGIEYVEIDPSALTGTPNDVDDIAIDPTDGQMYAVANNSGGNNDRLIRVDKFTGAVTDVGRLFEDLDNDDVFDAGEEVNDMEGFSFFNDGTFYGTTGVDGAAGTNDVFWQVNTATGEVTRLAAFGIHSDYEAVACLTGGSNTIDGTVFKDDDGDGALDAGEAGTTGVTVFLYIDENNDGQVDAGDTLIQTAETDANGEYLFEFAIDGNFVVEIDTADLPADHVLTTDNVEEADFIGYGNSDSNNDFGWIDDTDIQIVKSASPDPVTVGDNLTYTLTITNNGPAADPNVVVTDTLPSGVTWVSTTPSQGSCSAPSGVTCELGALANGAIATITIVVTVN